MNKLVNDLKKQIASYISLNDLASLRSTSKSMRNFGRYRMTERDRIRILKKLYDRRSVVAINYDEKKFYVEVLKSVIDLYDHCQEGLNLEFQYTVRNAQDLYHRYMNDLEDIMEDIIADLRRQRSNALMLTSSIVATVPLETLRVIFRRVLTLHLHTFEHVVDLFVRQRLQSNYHYGYVKNLLFGVKDKRERAADAIRSHKYNFAKNLKSHPIGDSLKSHGVSNIIVNEFPPLNRQQFIDDRKTMHKFWTDLGIHSRAELDAMRRNTTRILVNNLHGNMI